jgi:hypothetical protein
MLWKKRRRKLRRKMNRKKLKKNQNEVDDIPDVVLIH